jgi:hypothetical protein
MSTAIRIYVGVYLLEMYSRKIILKSGKQSKYYYGTILLPPGK